MAPKPADVAEFYAAYDRHPDDRVRLFGALAARLGASLSVLYPGSFVDVAPSVWFDTVCYLDLDKRANRFFAEHGQVLELIKSKRSLHGSRATALEVAWHHQDYTEPIALASESCDLLVSLYAGFISEHCLGCLKVGGHLLVNPSHGDAAMAALNPLLELAGVIKSGDGTNSDGYRVVVEDLDSYMIPKKEQEVTVESLRKTGRGVAYTKSPFAYLFIKL